MNNYTPRTMQGNSENLITVNRINKISTVKLRVKEIITNCNILKLEVINYVWGQNPIC